VADPTQELGIVEIGVVKGLRDQYTLWWTCPELGCVTAFADRTVDRDLSWVSRQLQRIHRNARAHIIEKHPERVPGRGLAEVGAQLDG
jgi:hypothetical protein